MKIEVGKKYRVGGNCRYTGNVIKITRKADLYGRADCYYAGCFSAIQYPVFPIPLPVPI